MLRRLSIRFLFIYVVIVAFSAIIFSQDLDNVSIVGRLTDSNNLAIVGAALTVTEVGTGIERNVVTDADGRYEFANLKPGPYKIKAAATGFGAQEKIGLQTVSGQRLELNFKLLPADVKAETTVTVDDESANMVDTTRTVVGGTITQREIEEIPVNTRNPLDLVLTLGGTSEEQLATEGLAEDRNQNPSTAPLEQGNYSLSGGVAYSNNITIDGLDNNDDYSSRDRFQPSMESIAEVQVITNQFSAEYGRASGGRINIRTRAGNNNLHGRFFMFFRDNNLNANSWYNNSRGFARPPLAEYDPGFTLSGPVRLPFYDGHDRTFFSVTYEYDNLRDTTFIDTFVPTGSNPRFTLPTSTGPCPTGIACTDASSSPPTAIGAFQQSLFTPNLSHVLTARIDHRLTKQNDLTIGFQFGNKNNRRTTGASTTRLDDALQARNSDTQGYNLTDNHVFSSQIINQYRMQFSVYKPSFETNEPFAPVVLIGYTNPITGGTQTLTAGNSTTAITGDATAFPQNRNEHRWQYQDSLTYIIKNHTLKGGFDIQTVRSRAIGLGDATGTYNFTGVLNYENNTLSRYRQNFGTAADVTNTYYGVFLNDEMRARKDLTISYGLRYERETAVSDNNNWGPRLGIAWAPFKDGKGVIRFGSGIFYNRVLLRTVADSIQNTGGNQVSFDTSLIGTSATDSRRVAILAAVANGFPNAFSSVDSIKNMLAAVCPTVVAPLAPCTTSTGFLDSVTSTGNPLRTVQPDLKIPESYQFNIGFEREIVKGLVFEANYTINKTVHLWRDINGNAPLLPTGYGDWSAYLLANPFILSPTRKYTFFLGDPSDASGLHISSPTGATPCTTTTANCYVNLNTSSQSTTTPAVASTGTNGNSTGGPIGIALADIAKFRPNPNLEETSVIGSMGNAFYQGLILELRSRARKLGGGFSMSIRGVYTLSETMDDGLNNTSNAQINSNFGREWARSLQDRRHRVAVSGTFDTPSWLGRLKFSPLMRWGSSAPIGIGNGGSDRNLDDVSTDRPNYTGNLNDIVWRGPGSTVPTALIGDFSLPTIGAPGGSLPRNAGKGPEMFTFDMNLTREWKIGEHFRLRPQLEVDNVFNAAVFNFGAEFIDYTGTVAIPGTVQNNFLVPTRTWRQRQIRVGLRFDF